MILKHTLYKAVFVIIALGFFTTTSYAEIQDDAFENAVEAYKRGDYQTSISVLEALDKENLVSSEVYYNLGNSYYKSGYLGKAIWAYERAKIINPRDEDVEWNLNLMQKHVKDKSYMQKEHWFFSPIKKYLDYVTSKELSFALMACVALFSVSLILYIFIPVARPFFLRACLLSVVLITLSVICVGLRWVEVRYPSGIVGEREVYVRYGPDTENTKAFLLHEGSKVSIEKESGGWYFVRFGNAQSGWLPKHTVLKI